MPLPLFDIGRAGKDPSIEEAIQKIQVLLCRNHSDERLKVELSARHRQRLLTTTQQSVSGGEEGEEEEREGEKHLYYLKMPIARKYFPSALANDRSGLCISAGGVGSGGSATGRSSEVGREGPWLLPQGRHCGM